jgi:hypothetical protein
MKSRHCTACLIVCGLVRTAIAIDFPDHPGVALNASELATLSGQLGFPRGGDRATAGAPLAWKVDLYRAKPVAGLMQGANGLRANAELWLAREIEIPARGGHYHHFFCEDGDRLEIPPDQKYVPGPYKCSKCDRRYSGEKYEAAVRRLVHSWLAQAAWSLAIVSAVEDRGDCAAKSAEILKKYAAAYPGPHTGRTEGGMVYQSLDESMWVIPLAQAYDLIHARLRPDERERIEAFLRIVAAGIQGCGTGGNWGSWHLSAVGVVGFAIHDATLVDWAIDQFRRQIRDELGDDGLWPESVHTYHYFPLLAFMYLAEAAGHADIDLYHWEAKPGKSLLSMFTAPLAYAYPDFRLPAINDGWFESFVPADCYELAYHRSKSPSQFAWVIANAYDRGAPAGTTSGSQGARRSGLYAFLFGGDIPEVARPPAQRSIDFPVLGICMLRSADGAMMSFDYGPFLGHGQFDKLGVTLFAHDKLWVADYGTPGYGSSILSWYVSTFAHNTVVVDGQSQQRTKENTAKLWLDGNDIEAAQSSSMQVYPGVTHTRTVLRTADYFVVLDDLASAEPHVYDLYWHAEGNMSLDCETQSAEPGKLDPRISDVKSAASRTGLAARWQEDGSGVACSIIADGLFTPIVAQMPAETAARRVALLICRRESASAAFITALLPFRGGGEVQVRRENDTLVVSTTRFTDTITLPYGDRRPVFSGQQTDR